MEPKQKGNKVKGKGKRRRLEGGRRRARTSLKIVGVEAAERICPRALARFFGRQYVIESRVLSSNNIAGHPPGTRLTWSRTHTDRNNQPPCIWKRCCRRDHTTAVFQRGGR